MKMFKMTNCAVYLLRLLILILVTSQVYNSQSSNQISTFTDCGGTLRDSRGVITSPNFPNAYPVPIYCKWVIEAPEDKVVAVYFTQYYMRDGLRAAEYTLYTEGLKMEKEDFGILNSDKEPTYLITNKHILVLEFSVRETGNIHLRIRQFFLDVFGFNITYEIIGKNQNVRKDECLYHHCSFTGKCFATADYESYYCSCFSDFFGKECQYNESCGPTAANTLCMNGGTCRFYIGSTAQVCECLPGYKGATCEIKTEMDLDECANYGCSQSCTVKENKEIICTCPGGYYLLDDGKTCTQEGKTRYFVSIKMYEQNVDLAHLDSVRYKQLKKGVENALNALLKPRLYQVDNLTVTSFEPSPIVHFHFLGEKDDNQQAKVVLEEALKTGKIDKYRVNRTYLILKWEPALSIQGIETSEKMPIVEGTEFSLACIAQGSASMSFKWFKDGAPINVHTPYRTIWTSQVPKNSRDQYTALLGFDRTNILDSGVFTCQVSDWDNTHNKSLQVNVISAPLFLLEPLTATIYQGQSFIITCIPETYGKFGYTWLKNGKVLNPSLQTELIEDLYPVGTRLLVHSAKSSVIYTCIISSNTGTTKKDSIITVIDKETPICQSERHKNIEWSITAANTVNLQNCPHGYEGIISRKCVIRKGNIASWEEPDYSSCLSARLKSIKTQFDSMKMGYYLTDLETIIQELKAYILDKKSNLHHAEGEPIAEMLEGMLDYYENINNQFNISWNISETFIDIISFLLETPYLIKKQSHIFKLYNNIKGFGEIRGSLIEVDSLEVYQKELFELEIKRIEYDKTYHLRFPHLQRPRNALRSKILQSWLTNSIEIEINNENEDKNNNYNMSATSIFFKNLTEYLPEHYFTRLGGLDIEYQLHSQPVAVSFNGIGIENLINTQSVSIRVKMAHLKNKSQMLKNITCGIADFSDNKFDFLMDGCQVISVRGNYTTCQCYRMGMYAVLLTSFTNAKSSNQDEFEIIAGIGCSIGAFLLCLTFFMLLILWKKLRGAITALKLQVCIALIGAYIAILKSLQESLSKEYYSYILSIIQFFLLAAFSMQLCLGLIVYIEFTNLQSIKYPELKVAAMGWAVPTIVVGATLASQVPEGFLIESWWLKFGTNFFLSYTIAVIIIFVLQLILFLTVKAEIRHHQKEESPKQKIIGNRTKLLCRSLVISVALLLTSVFSILYINYEDDIFKYLFSFSSAALGLIVFLCYTFCSENAFLLCCPKTSNDDDDEKEEPKLNTESNSFRSFLKPE
ncbi:uncharacterized protein [Centruroides vittatus]|uniref:uncharacterized protein isoform X2 n=1 Tax=Centruroides vittatus TaxID=120091 RepID=UPI0035106D56